MRRRVILVAAPLALVAAFGLSAVASAAAPPGVSTATLSGAAEVPGPGDTDGRGSATVQVKPNAGQVCVSIRYRSIDAPTAAHIHEGSSTVAGPVRVDFTPLLAVSPPGTLRGCVAADPDLARSIGQNPQNFYLNVHNVAFYGGAIRGQLADAP